ncbi:MAG TPA: hypothetical protein VIT65_00700, partial [Microlunatus sp.]
MISEVLPEPAASALQAALDGVRTSVGHLVKVVDDGALTDLGASGLVGFLAEFEQVRNTGDRSGGDPVRDRARRAGRVDGTVDDPGADVGVAVVGGGGPPAGESS